MANNVHDLIKEERRKRGIRTFYWSREMARLAQSQANYCAKVGRLVHSKNLTPPWGENLAQGGPRFSPREIVDCWLRSKAGHRENLLNPTVTKAGVGIARRNGKTYVAWTYSGAPPTYPDCPSFKQPRKKHYPTSRPGPHRTGFERWLRSTARTARKRCRHLFGQLRWRLKTNYRPLLLVVVAVALVLAWSGVKPFSSWWEAGVASTREAYVSINDHLDEVAAQNDAEIEADILEYSNAARREAGLPALVRSNALDGLASGHCHDMATTHHLSHDGFDERAHSAYMAGCSSFGENCAEGYRSGEAAVRGWMGSPGHRANILGAGYRVTGIAYEDGYTVQVFGG